MTCENFHLARIACTHSRIIFDNTFDFTSWKPKKIVNNFKVIVYFIIIVSDYTTCASFKIT